MPSLLQNRPIKVCWTMIRSSVCVFLILLQLYICTCANEDISLKSVLLSFPKSVDKSSKYSNSFLILWYKKVRIIFAVQTCIDKQWLSSLFLKTPHKCLLLPQRENYTTVRRPCESNNLLFYAMKTNQSMAQQTSSAFFNLLRIRNSSCRKFYANYKHFENWLNNGFVTIFEFLKYVVSLQACTAKIILV